MRRSAWGLVAVLALAGCEDAQSVDRSPAGLSPVTTETPVATEAPADNYAAFAAVLQQHRARAARVARISRRLRVANAPLCDVTRPDIGLATHRLSDYPAQIQPLAEHFMDITGEGRFVRFVVPGSPADDVDIRRGQRIVSGWPVGDTSVEGRAALTLDTLDGPQRVALTPDTACVTPTFVVQSDTLNASTDGREIDLSSALVDQAGDDSGLAFIIAHEMAHIIRPPADGESRWAVELQADADALVLMRNAGFDIDGTVREWAAGVELHRDSQALSATHPPVDIRLEGLRKALSDTQRRSSLIEPGAALSLN